jgi:hypothetical protein
MHIYIHANISYMFTHTHTHTPAVLSYTGIHPCIQLHTNTQTHAHTHITSCKGSSLSLSCCAPHLTNVDVLASLHHRELYTYIHSLHTHIHKHITSCKGSSLSFLYDTSRERRCLSVLISQGTEVIRFPFACKISRWGMCHRRSGSAFNLLWTTSSTCLCVNMCVCVYVSIRMYAFRLL